VISIPNRQIANATIETLSARDKYWFHPIVALQHETSAEQLKTVIHGIGNLLVQQPLCDPESVRVRLLRLGVSSLDVEVVAYFNTRDWNHFLQIQEELLVGMTDLVSRAGTRLALPAQRMYMASR
jgi:MscS family membrane protein